MRIDQLLNTKPFALTKEEKKTVFSELLSQQIEDQRNRCRPYGQFLEGIGIQKGASFSEISQLPFLPVSIFKLKDLSSVNPESVYKEITSSGTSSQGRSRIYLDEETSERQQRALRNIVGDFIGERRVPYLILDCPKTVRDRTRFSARTAGIIGFSIFASEMCFALDDDMSINFSRIEEFLKKHPDGPILIFGFTFIIWKHWVLELAKTNRHPDLSRGVLVHGGGWKKLQNEAVSENEFRERLGRCCGLKSIHNYYGMAEQTGSICMECEEGHLHVSSYSDILIRRPSDFGVCVLGEPGMIEVISPLPSSYPGHCLLTEDIGILLGEDDCACGRKGKYFRILGRAPRSEIRGCSDTYEG